MGALRNKLEVCIRSGLRKKDYEAKFGVWGMSKLSKQICTVKKTINKMKMQHTEYDSDMKKEWNFVIRDNMEWPWGYYAK